MTNDYQLYIQVKKAIKKNKLFLLKNLLSDYTGNYDINWINAAGKKNFVHIVSFLREKGCPWDVTFTYISAANDSLDCLMYAYENGCPWDVTITAAAAKKGSIDCLKYLHENGCPWDVTTISSAVKYASSFYDGIDNMNIYLECLKYAHENGCPWDSTVYLNVKFYSYEEYVLPTLQYLRENGCPWDSTATAAAAKEGSIDCLKYLHENGCPWDSTATAAAAKEGSIDCLKYLHENGCPWDETCITNCIFSKYPKECLNYACENGCPITIDHIILCINNIKDKNTILEILFSNFNKTIEISNKIATLKKDILCDIYKYGCPWDKSTVLTTVINNNFYNWKLLWDFVSNNTSYKGKLPMNIQEFVDIDYKGNLTNFLPNIDLKSNKWNKLLNVDCRVNKELDEFINMYKRSTFCKETNEEFKKKYTKNDTDHVLDSEDDSDNKDGSDTESGSDKEDKKREFLMVEMILLFLLIQKMILAMMKLKKKLKKICLIVVQLIKIFTIGWMQICMIKIIIL
jgi:uncharacterized protein CbrC (UPF0167 family)